MYVTQSGLHSKLHEQASKKATTAENQTGVCRTMEQSMNWSIVRKQTTVEQDLSVQVSCFYLQNLVTSQL